MNHWIAPAIEGEIRKKIKNPDVDLIFRAVEHTTGITYQQLIRRTRYKNIVMPRMVAMYIMHHVTTMTLSQIGAWFHLQHATVIHAIRKVENPYDHELRKLYIQCNNTYIKLRKSHNQLMELNQHINIQE